MPHTTQARRASRRSLIGLIAAAGLAAAVPAAAQAQAQNYPDRPITLVVPYTPGGQFDAHARLIAKRMSTLLNQQVIVDNKPGAGTTIGAEYVARAKPDGYTLLMAGATMFTIAPHTFASLRYKIDDFQTVSLLNQLPMALMVNPQVMPVKDFKEFVAYAKANPGKVNYATTGPGVATHLLGELTKSQMGIDITPVHYKGTGPAMLDLLAGRVQATFDGVLSHAPMIKEGKEVALAISSEKRLPGAPNIPTFAELGYPALSMASWAGIVVPKGTPPAIVEKLHQAVVAAVQSDEVNKRMVADATVPMSSTPAEFDALIKRDYDTWGNLIKKIGGIRIE
ncbi:MAG: tripartite tricarboxylate transporter substrate binding protein [Burkholderiaceae bacterium]|nr:tripartite tricarboxylate transporter substrate binding protein [Burkholderiaceae bacterium]